VRSIAQFAALVALMACACSSGQSTTAPSGTTAAAAACRPSVSAPAGPINDPNGPFFHQVVVATTSDDGRTIQDPLQVIDHASVPDGTRMADGSIAVYYVNAADGGVWLARVSSTVASPIGPITINGFLRPQGVVDPDATLLPDGRIRLVYLQNTGGASPSHAICIAESTDGLQFQTVATALDLGPTSSDTDPSVTQLRDGSWLMAISRGQQTVLARSPDGLRFVVGEALAFGGVPEVTALGDGRVRLYVCANGIESFVSSDSGRNWQREGVVVPPRTLGRSIVCDPSRVAGTTLFVFKTAN